MTRKRVVMIGDKRPIPAGFALCGGILKDGTTCVKMVKKGEKCPRCGKTARR